MSTESTSAARILALRTAALAARGGEAAPASAPRPWILARGGGVLAGLDLGSVAAVARYNGCARLPTRLPACLGVIGRDGRFYSVLHLGALLGRGTDAQPRHLIFLAGDGLALAIAAEALLGHVDLPSEPAAEHEGEPVTILDPRVLRAAAAGGGRP